MTSSFSMTKYLALAILLAFVFTFQSQSHAEVASIDIGSVAPDFKLPNSKGEERTLYDLLKDGPVVLSFYRGGWCPYCNEQLYAYQQIIPEFEKRGAQLVAISPESPESAAETVMANDLSFEVLSDLGNKVARSYDLIWKIPTNDFSKFSQWLKDTTGKTLTEYNGLESDELPIPATLVINRNGKVVYIYKNEDYKQRAANDEIIAALEKLTIN